MAPKTAYRILIGCDYPSHTTGKPRRGEPGDVVTDLPAPAVRQLLEQAAIVLVDQGGD